ncbi:hypothetical protein THAOC_29556, partial [Thalassiosira oceanica]
FGSIGSSVGIVASPSSSSRANSMLQIETTSRRVQLPAADEGQERLAAHERRGQRTKVLPVVTGAAATLVFNVDTIFYDRFLSLINDNGANANGARTARHARLPTARRGRAARSGIGFARRN